MSTSLLHIANTFFEWECEADPHVDLYQAFHKHPVYLQLQFLPLLYANPGEEIVCSDLPEEEYIARCPMRLRDLRANFSGAMIETWGASQIVQKWAAAKGIVYKMPPYEVVKQINAKDFTLEMTSRLPSATLVRDETEAKRWLELQTGPCVFKSCFGVSGRGHLHAEPGETSWEKILTFLKREWQADRPVVAEPWVQRVLDFSTQWKIAPSGDIAFIGATLMGNDARGGYLWSRSGSEAQLFSAYRSFVDDQKVIAESLLRHVSQLGYFGEVGLDAMLFRQGDRVALHPVVEMNARKTMGWVCATFQQKQFPTQVVQLEYTTEKTGLLPHTLVTRSAKKIHFERNLQMHVYN